MENGKQLVTYDVDKALKLDTIADKLRKSGMFPHIKDAAQSFAIVAYGYELGLSPMAALQSLVVIKGKLAAEAKLMLAMYIKDGGKFTVKKSDTEVCEIDFAYSGNKYSSKFTAANAQVAGLLAKDNWKNYREQMLYWRCVAKGIRAIAPGVMFGIYTLEEISEGEILTVSEIKPESKSKSIGKNGKIGESDLKKKPEIKVSEDKLTEPASPDPKMPDYKAKMAEAAEMKKTLGATGYYKILNSFGYKHFNAIPKFKEMDAIMQVMEETAAGKGRKKPAPAPAGNEKKILPAQVNAIQKLAKQADDKWGVPEVIRTLEQQMYMTPIEELPEKEARIIIQELQSEAGMRRFLGIDQGDGLVGG